MAKFSRQNFIDRLQFYLGTWTGRILVCNFILFALITVMSGDLFAPEGEILILWGAKDPVSIAQGEWWRLLTPIFLHFGIIHFLLNSIALKIIGAYLEPLLGTGWFLLIFLGSGVMGNVMSSLGNVSLGAGASGAIFGLIGVGMLIEQVIAREEFGQRFRVGPFTSMALLNIVIAVVFNFVVSLSGNSGIGIDNAAHLGGLGAGLGLGLSMFYLRKNRFFQRKVFFGAALIASFMAIVGLGSYLVLRTPFIFEHLRAEAAASENDYRAYYFYTQAIALDTSDPQLRFERGKVLFRLGEIKRAFSDFLYASHHSFMLGQFQAFREKLLNETRHEEAAILDLLIKRMEERVKKI
ncbi:MAG: rhomboid family intramembrane serine protease [Deltaproteobacteria bacterium]|nr:rhomboid family intramembrane serine protease [Deltaproteobacteria bacterium]